MIGKLPLPCPSCGAAGLELSLAGLKCGACEAVLPRRGGVFDMAPDSGETQLDVAAYAGEGGLSDPQVRALAHGFETVLDTVAGPTAIFPEVLEIGAGHGPQTWTFTQSDRYGRVYATDLSMEFLTRLARNIPDDKVLPLRVPGEGLSAVQSSLDLVVGRSVLHHIADYKALLHKTRRWLRSGGVAMFFEPNIEGKMWVAFYIELILRLAGSATPDDMSIKGRAAHRLKSLARTAPANPAFALSAAVKTRLQNASAHIRKDFVYPDIEARRTRLEDKHIFAFDDLLQAARDVGFSEVSYHDQDQTGGHALSRIKQSIRGLFGPDAAQFDRLAPLFEAFEASFGLSDATLPVSPMGWFAFKA